jgi:penicillin-binding protein 2
MSPAGEVVHEVEVPVAGQVPATPETLAYLQDALRSVSTDGTAAGVFAGWPHEQIPVGAKTGSGQVSRDRETTSWFASFTDRYAVVMMVEEGGSGSGTSGPGVRAIYDAIYGVAEDGTIDPQAAIRPGGLPPQELPTITPDGMVVAPDSREVAPASREVPPAADVTAGRGP